MMIIMSGQTVKKPGQGLLDLGCNYVRRGAAGESLGQLWVFLIPPSPSPLRYITPLLTRDNQPNPLLNKTLSEE